MSGGWTDDAPPGVPIGRDKDAEGRTSQEEESVGS